MATIIYVRYVARIGLLYKKYIDSMKHIHIHTQSVLFCFQSGFERRSFIVVELS